MRKVGLFLATGALALLGACSDGAVSTNNGSVTVNTSVIGGDVQNNLEGAGNFARNSARSLGNGLDRAGEVIENNAKAAWNAVKEKARELRGNDDGNASTNASTNTTGN